MINLKKWMAKVSEKLKITTADYTATTGTEQYAGVYYANIALTKSNPSMFYVYDVTSNRPAYAQRVSSNMIRLYSPVSGTVATVRCIYIPDVGGSNILFTPLNRIAQILRRKEVGAVC